MRTKDWRTTLTGYPSWSSSSLSYSSSINKSHKWWGGDEEGTTDQWTPTNVGKWFPVSRIVPRRGRKPSVRRETGTSGPHEYQGGWKPSGPIDQSNSRWTRKRVAGNTHRRRRIIRSRQCNEQDIRETYDQVRKGTRVESTMEDSVLISLPSFPGGWGGVEGRVRVQDEIREVNK